MELGWVQLISAALGGGATVKALDIAYQEFRQRSERSRSARKFLDDHLDPVLKAADELVGKLRSLAESDFKSLHDVRQGSGIQDRISANTKAVAFLFAILWARIEILNRQALSIALSESRQGKSLQSFLDCLESKRIRIVDRILQRAIGELMIKDANGILSTNQFITFAKSYAVDAEVRGWLKPLLLVLSRTSHTYERQKVLQYGVVVHAFIDTLDPKHLVTRERPSFPNKLSRRSWRDLNYRVFGRYLPFVSETSKYIGPPKKSAARE